MWTGQRYDAVTGTYHFHDRTYSPGLGRWLQRDPAGYVDGVNLYAYAMQNPQAFTDQLGQSAFIFISGGTLKRLKKAKENLDELREEWGDGSCSQGNCYRFACDDPTRSNGGEYFRSPPGAEKGVSCESVRKGAIKDGLQPTNKDGSCPTGSTKVAIVVNSEGIDYHWYRFDPSTGFWAHKPGNTRVEYKDSSGKLIQDPSNCDRNSVDWNGNPFSYDKFCGYLCVPKRLDLEQEDEPCDKKK